MEKSHLRVIRDFSTVPNTQFKKNECSATVEMTVQKKTILAIKNRPIILLIEALYLNTFWIIF